MTARNSKPLTATQCADKIATRNSTRDKRIHDAMQAAASAAELAIRDADKRADERDMVRVPESERPKVAAVLLALGHELCGMEVVAGNDAGAETETVPRGARPYQPGPVAAAAQGAKGGR